MRLPVAVHRVEADVAVIGSSFAGSLLALILRRLGLDVVLIDRERHPRFAIGESSTPAADLILADLCERYDLPRLAPLARYGPWRQAYPNVRCGRKRGFSYFHHRRDRPFEPRDDHANELLVTASASDAVADTHWYRADVDTFFGAEAASGGVEVMEGFDITRLDREDHWRIHGTWSGSAAEVHVGFLVDSSGRGGVVPNQLGLPDRTSSQQTDSWCVFGHFRGVQSWGALLSEWGGRIEDHPFDCDAAALHHILDGAWIWVLPFDGGLTSVGLVMDGRHHPPPPSGDADAVWGATVAHYPSIGEQFATVELTAPFATLRATGRLRRQWMFEPDDTWTMLPGTAGFVDPFFSTGIAHSLAGVERVARAFESRDDPRTFTSRLADHARVTTAELGLVDRLVAASYRTFGEDPRLLHSVTMLYFAAATTWERVRFDGARQPGAYLLAGDAEWLTCVDRCLERLQSLPGADAESVTAFERFVARELRPYNTAGLCDPEAHNMYRYTAAPV